MTMQKNRRTFVSHPTEKNVLVVVTAWLLSVVLLLCAMTDFFQMPFIVKENIVMLFLIGSSTSVVFEVLLNFYRLRKKKENYVEA